LDAQDGTAGRDRVHDVLTEYWAFSVDDDLRVVFRWNGDEAFLVNPGSHDEVY
jgi:hypothetical protein